MVSTRKADQIKSPADWVGKSLGVTGLGAGSHLMLQYLAGNNGVPIGQVTFIPAGAGNTFIAGLQQGKIDAGWATDPTISRLLKTGEAKVLVDLRTPAAARGPLGGDYPFISVWLKADYIQSHKPEVQRLVNAYVKTLKWISTHRR
jgi:NitT/TauT family transport system substrate-binding protein